MPIHDDVRVRPKPDEELGGLIKRIMSAIGKAGHVQSIKQYKQDIDGCLDDDSKWATIHKWVTIVEESNKQQQEGEYPSALEYMKQLHTFIPWYSIEQRGKRAELLSNSELKRILDAGHIHFNGESVTSDELIDFPVFSLVMYPTSDVLKNSVI